MLQSADATGMKRKGRSLMHRAKKLADIKADAIKDQKETDKIPPSVRNFKLLTEHKRKPLFKMINAAEGISKSKKKGNHRLMKLIERLDLDRPLILKEKLDIIWNEKKGDPIVI